MQVAKQARKLVTHLSTTAKASTLGVLLLLLAGSAAQAQTYAVIHNFTGGAEGGRPEAPLTIDQRGNLYGTTYEGGHSAENCNGGCGVVFKMQLSGQSWLFTPLYQFAGGSDGGNPVARVVFGPDGSLYGTTLHAGGVDCANDAGFGCGTVVNLRPKPTNCIAVPCLWTDVVLHRFAGGAGDGAMPVAPVAFDATGNLYGTTLEGGGSSPNCSNGNNSCGTVFELARSNGGWTESVPYSFTGGGDGGNPEGGLVLDRAGNLYSTASVAGAGNGGTVFALVPNGSGWTQDLLYSFTAGGATPYEPEAGLIFDAAGNLYGTTAHGGGAAAVFELMPSNGGWTFSQIYAFGGSRMHQGPLSDLVMDGAGNLYGTAYDLGLHNAGLVYELSPSNGGWIFTDLYDFPGGGGDASPSGVALDANGNLYGTAAFGGTHGWGVVWEITP